MQVDRTTDGGELIHRVTESRAAQGLPATVTDLGALRAVGTALAGAVDRIRMGAAGLDHAMIGEWLDS